MAEFCDGILPSNHKESYGFQIPQTYSERSTICNQINNGFVNVKENNIKNVQEDLTAIDLFESRNSDCNFEETKSQKALTKSAVRAGNDGYDNEDGDYILYADDILGNEKGHQ